MNNPTPVNPTESSRRLATMVGLVVALLNPQPRRDERGLSQSTENAVLLAGAVAVAIVVITAVTNYVTKNMPK
ncbi:hypothetical protein AAEX63_08015 [Luteococcus sp. H138]|uniref:hypothetical protein n=1 Tax=unclassified Luteococcus TaxID=2639923 RepID=UPI00313C5A14